MGKTPQVLDRWGRPVKRSALTEEVAAPTVGGVRSPIAGYPADGLTPLRLASILREADQGDPVQYLELAETIEERDPHYLGVLGTRRRSVSQIDVTVEAASDSAQDQKIAQMVRDWLKRDELTEEIFDILDTIGKGYSFTEIIWETSEGQWQPARLEWRDPRWFRFARHDLATPLMLDENGQEVPLSPFKFVFAQIRAKSGIALRSGLARVATWGWMFKAYTQRDWAIFTQTYGQPVRLGKYGAGASDRDKDTLFRAVANIAGDCAAIIPDSMSIDFVEAKSIGSSTDHYEKRSDWLDKQISKAVLGQTSTTDAVTGGLGSGQEHREVQEDIERADARALAAILNRDLIRPWVDLEHGPKKAYPRLVIARPEKEDLTAFSNALAPLITAGLRVRQSEVRDKFGLSDPDEKDEILVPRTVQPSDGNGNGAESAVKYPLKGRRAAARGIAALQAEIASAARSAPHDEIAPIIDRMAREADPEMEAMLAQVEVMLQAAGSLEEFREMLLAGFPDLDASGFANVLGDAMAAAHAGGRATVEEDGDG
ncbi:DUF935 domain-containing protein [Chachezhania antarctica]|uniref:DUF935 domain-containing protein n=1 Tax=Chachezhania antarctica TaxID=2340860 RepID=UPI000EAF88D8|nr:DUF935 domain-containing protein [Chachezhania antarctica]|tara:strand:- start:1469 stop:3094 length:1626 start_codon:yes stop_codon:yes gene_type:complete